jgi:hypothetical protein
MVDVGRRLVTQGCSGTVLIGPVRLQAAVPEAPGRVRRYGREEVGEIRCVVVGRDLTGRWLDRPSIERLASHLARLSLRILSHSWCPTFGRHPHEVTVLRQDFRIRRELGREVRDVIAGRFELPRVAAGQDAGARRCALRVRRVSACEQQSLARYAVERRRLDPAAAVSAHVRVRSIVRDRHENVRTLGAGCVAAGQQSRKDCQDDVHA